MGFLILISDVVWCCQLRSYCSLFCGEKWVLWLFSLESNYGCSAWLRSSSPTLQCPQRAATDWPESPCDGRVLPLGGRQACPFNFVNMVLGSRSLKTDLPRSSWWDFVLDMIFAEIITGAFVVKRIKHAFACLTVCVCVCTIWIDVKLLLIAGACGTHVMSYDTQWSCGHEWEGKRGRFPVPADIFVVVAR